MTVFNRPNDTYRAIIGKARKRADEKIEHKGRDKRVKTLSLARRFEGRPERLAKYRATIEETRRLGLPSPGAVKEARPPAFRTPGLTKRSRKQVKLALTPVQVADRNRAQLLKAVQRAAVKKQAQTLKAAADAHGRRQAYRYDWLMRT